MLRDSKSVVVKLYQAVGSIFKDKSPESEFLTDGTKPVESLLPENTIRLLSRRKQ